MALHLKYQSMALLTLIGLNCISCALAEKSVLGQKEVLPVRKVPNLDRAAESYLNWS